MNALNTQNTSSQSGFTLLEILLVLGILALLAGVGAGYYYGSFKELQLAAAVRDLGADLRFTQDQAMTGESGLRFGLHAVAGPPSYYEEFSTATNYADPGMAVVKTVYLPDGLNFSDPVPGGTKDIVFGRLSGTTTATALTITGANSSKTVNISALGKVE